MIDSTELSKIRRLHLAHKGRTGRGKGKERVETVGWWRALHRVIRYLLKVLSSPPGKSIHLIKLTELVWKQVKGSGFQFGAKEKTACVNVETRYKEIRC